jgi:citrate synthase
VVELVNRAVRDLPPAALPTDLLRIAGAFVEAYDPSGRVESAEEYAFIARRYMATTLSALPERSAPALPLGEPFGMAALLWSRLADHEPTQEILKLLNATMILLADHDLTHTTVAVRAAAQVGLDAGAIIRLGIDAGGSLVKGVASLAIETFLRDLAHHENVEVALTRRLKQGEPVPGFGHPVHGDGDPRAAVVLDGLRSAQADAVRMATIEAVIRAQIKRGLPPPNTGYALAALTYVSGMVPGAGETIYVVSRAAGWVAHAIEAAAAGRPERVYSVYVGPTPNETR